jgi:hypothetical protein
MIALPSLLLSFGDAASPPVGVRLIDAFVPWVAEIPPIEDFLDLLL